MPVGLSLRHLEEETSLLLPEPKDGNKQKPESLARYIIAHKLFLQFTTIIILQEQVHTTSYKRLQGFLYHLCNSKYISIFTTKHNTKPGKHLSTKDLCDILCFRDDLHLPIPSLFFYVQGILVMGPRSRGKSGFKGVTYRTGPLYMPTFMMIDQKSQGKQFSQVLLNLKGIYGSSVTMKPSFMSLLERTREET
ncbi:hypothetical protein B0T25DRAFT_590134 [Lasiosphaeria hispida]|uniref:Uncharacterized protein n=1 Tax=Lasiosphaeria hispida TaxID=260671 RepID=A0AAJ0MGS6_9PEZI|nr:hypothetical protein B0T25DRAFT_590134 [Lasiosphaeria hispida]